MLGWSSPLRVLRVTVNVFLRRGTTLPTKCRLNLLLVVFKLLSTTTPVRTLGATVTERFTVVRHTMGLLSVPGHYARCYRRTWLTLIRRVVTTLLVNRPILLCREPRKVDLVTTIVFRRRKTTLLTNCKLNLLLSGLRLTTTERLVTGLLFTGTVVELDVPGVEDDALYVSMTIGRDISLFIITYEVNSCSRATGR